MATRRKPSGGIGSNQYGTVGVSRARAPQARVDRFRATSYPRRVTSATIEAASRVHEALQDPAVRDRAVRIARNRYETEHGKGLWPDTIAWDGTPYVIDAEHVEWRGTSGQREDAQEHRARLTLAEALPEHNKPDELAAARHIHAALQQPGVRARSLIAARRQVEARHGRGSFHADARWEPCPRIVGSDVVWVGHYHSYGDDLTELARVPVTVALADVTDPAD